MTIRNRNSGGIMANNSSIDATPSPLTSAIDALVNCISPQLLKSAREVCRQPGCAVTSTCLTSGERVGSLVESVMRYCR